MNVTRYDLAPLDECISAYAVTLEPQPHGDYVDYDDYAKLEAERDRLREALTEALDELSWSEEDDYLTAETRASRDRWMSKMRRIAALQEASDD